MQCTQLHSANNENFIQTVLRRLPKNLVENETPRKKMPQPVNRFIDFAQTNYASNTQVTYIAGRRVQQNLFG